MRKSKFQGLCAKIFQTSRHLGFKIFRNAMTFHMALDSPKWYSCVSIGGNGQSRQGLIWDVNFGDCRCHSYTKASVSWVTDIECRKPRNGELVTGLFGKWGETCKVEGDWSETREGQVTRSEAIFEGEHRTNWDWKLKSNHSICRRKIKVKARTQAVTRSGGAWWSPRVAISGLVWRSNVPWRRWPCLV